MSGLKIFTLVATLVAIVASGSVFFRLVEGWSWLDSYFFTVVTISTVGYGTLVPATALGKVGTTVLIFVGLGVFAVAIQQFGSYTMRKREEHTEWLFTRLGRGEDGERAANLDEDPHDPEPAAQPGRDREPPRRG